MKYSLLILSFLCLAACDQRVSTNTPKQDQPQAISNTPPKTTDGTGTQPVSVATNKEGNKVEKSQAADEIKASDKLELSEEEWKKRLTPEEYYILRKKGTERAFTGKYDKFYKKGKYLCAACGLELFTSETKFDSGCGWPAFYASKAGDRVKLHEDFTFGMVRTEVTCARCDGHLGHIFDDAPQTPTGQRYCINSVAIKFVPADEDAKTPDVKKEAPADK